MKNIIKKISAFAMAFTILGTGAATTKIVSPQTDNSIVATAASQNDVTKIFKDVKAGKWYVSAIQFVYDRQIMIGKSSNIFDPEALLTLGEFATVLYNMAGKPETDYNSIFNDVPDGQWYTDSVLWTYYWGIAKGTGNGNFGVNTPITREQLVTMLYKYETIYKKRPCDTPSNALKNFTDANKVSDSSKDAMCWAISKKIISGKGNNILDPQGTATRAECAQIIKNYLVK
ncbi:S-layer homology domain-containing protein [Ruminococcus sp.]|uniref:S-layer homology domain-containing protein n=1 Tax=Ruminococcus sp. TaxID=41978 RepID=UPI0025D56B75|nr:S-layer homology domain-containing protein [Ruminococcus sp.]